MQFCRMIFQRLYECQLVQAISRLSSVPRKDAEATTNPISRGKTPPTLLSPRIVYLCDSSLSMIFNANTNDGVIPRENWVQKMMGVESLELDKRDIPATVGPWEWVKTARRAKLTNRAVVCPKRNGLW